MLPVSFWGYWTAGITVLGLLWLAWLAFSVFRAREGSIQSPDDVWDANLREGNSEPPKWWFLALFSAIIFSCVYVVLYPGLGDNRGILEWSQHGQFNKGMEYYNQRTEKIRQHWRTAPLAELREDKSAMNTARRLFSIQCAACHGEDGKGLAGLFPDLMDDEWHWGGSAQQIQESITKGRTAAMPGWRATYNDAEISALADYVLALSEERNVQNHAAHNNYAANCVACHGARGEGNIELGVPRFANHKWQYTDAETLQASIEKTIRTGRNGIMPAQENRLTLEQIRLLTAWLTGGNN